MAKLNLTENQGSNTFNTGKYEIRYNNDNMIIIKIKSIKYIDQGKYLLTLISPSEKLTRSMNLTLEIDGKFNACLFIRFHSLDTDAISPQVLYY